MVQTMKITKDYLIECFDYKDGCLVWKSRPENHFSSNGSFKQFNTRFAGKKAGFVKRSEGSQCSYLSICVSGGQYLAHRLVWFYVYGCWPSGEIDHIDGDGKNNKIENLRDVDSQSNAKNRPVQNNNKIGIIGVRERSGSWNARITNNGVLEELGTFKDFFSACCARKSAEHKYGFHKNHGR